MTLADIDKPELNINLGAGISWIANLDEEGSIRVLLPSGIIDVSSEFTTLQRGLNMTYSGGQAIGVEASQETPAITVSHSRIPFRDLSLNVIGSVGGDVSHDGGISDLLVTKDNESMGFNPVEFTCLLYTSPSPRDLSTSRMPSSA